MQLSPAGESALKQREGPNGQPALVGYLDDNGIPTAGYGHTGADVKVGAQYTEEQADAWFVTDSSWVSDCIAKQVKVSLTQGQYDALFSFIYNVGSGAFCSSTLLKKLNADDYASVPAEMLKWTISGGVKDPGLVNRRNSEGGQWVQGAYVRGSKIDVERPPSVWATAHVKAKALGTAIATSGVSATALTNAGDKAAQLAQSPLVQAIHAFAPYIAGIGILLTAVGIVWGIFKEEKA